MESLDRKIEDARDAVQKQDRTSQGKEIEFADPVKFLSTVSFSELPETPVLNAQPSATVISVLNTEKVKFANTSSVTVTNFTDGQNGQTIKLFGDGFTTIANNANIKTSSGANTLLDANKVYTFTYIAPNWIQDSTGLTYTAGAGIGISGSAISNLYVGKLIPLIVTSFSFVTSTGSFIISNTLHPRTDTTGMVNVRISYFVASTTGTGSWDPYISYSTNGGGTWTNVTFTGASISAAGGNVFRSVTTTLPVAARNAATWFRAGYTGASGLTVDLNSIFIELTP